MSGCETDSASITCQASDLPYLPLSVEELGGPIWKMRDAHPLAGHLDFISETKCIILR